MSSHPVDRKYVSKSLCPSLPETEDVVHQKFQRIPTEVRSHVILFSYFFTCTLKKYPRRIFTTHNEDECKVTDFEVVYWCRLVSPQTLYIRNHLVGESSLSRPPQRLLLHQERPCRVFSLNLYEFLFQRIFVTLFIC